jgi:signal peptidase I
MSPTTLLADPSIRLAGVRHRPRAERVAGEKGETSRSVATAPRRVSHRWLAVAAAIVLAVGVLGYLRTWPPLATVMSGSMEPTIKTGDMVVLQKLNRPARVGDIVSISVPADARARLGYPPVVIHRIVKISPEGDVTTQGDAHKQPDDFTVPRAALTTRVVTSVPAAGRVLAFLGSPLGLLWLVGGGVMLVAMPLVERHRDSRRREESTAADVHATLRQVTEELVLLRADRDRELEAAVQEAEAAKAELKAANAALAKHVEELPAIIERAVSAALAAYEPPPPPPPPPTPAPVLFVPASQWKAPTPDLMGALAQPSAWDAPPARRFQPRELAGAA